LNSKDKVNKASKTPLNKPFLSLTHKLTCSIWSQIPKSSRRNQHHPNPSKDRNLTRRSIKLKQATKAKNKKQLHLQVFKVVLISLSKGLKRMVRNPPNHKKLLKLPLPRLSAQPYLNSKATQSG